MFDITPLRILAFVFDSLSVILLVDNLRRIRSSLCEISNWNPILQCRLVSFVALILHHLSSLGIAPIMYGIEDRGATSIELVDITKIITTIEGALFQVFSVSRIFAIVYRFRKLEAVSNNSRLSLVLKVIKVLSVILALITFAQKVSGYAEWRSGVANNWGINLPIIGGAWNAFLDLVITSLEVNKANIKRMKIYVAVSLIVLIVLDVLAASCSAALGSSFAVSLLALDIVTLHIYLTFHLLEFLNLAIKAIRAAPGTRNNKQQPISSSIQPSSRSDLMASFSDQQQITSGLEIEAR